MPEGSCHAKSGLETLSVSRINIDTQNASIIYSAAQTKARITSLQASRMCSGRCPKVHVTPNQVLSHFRCLKSASTTNMLALSTALNKQKHGSPRKSLRASRMCSSRCPKVAVTPNQVLSHFRCLKSASTTNIIYSAEQTKARVTSEIPPGFPGVF